MIKKSMCLLCVLMLLTGLLCACVTTSEPIAESHTTEPSATEAAIQPSVEPEPPIEVSTEANQPPEPDFVEHVSIQPALPSPGDATVTLTGDEAVDLTGIPLSGRKEIILNGHTLTLTGAYGVSADAVLDIKPGDGADGSTLDMTGLTFDFGFLDGELPPEKALVEVRPGVTIDEPEYPDGVSIREFPDVLTVIQYD